MKKVSKIRWRDSDKEALQKLVNNYNAKIKYWQDKGKITPQKITMKDLKRNIYSRRDLKQTLNSYGKYLNRNEGQKTVITKSGKEMTEFEYKLTKKLWKKREKWKAERLKRLLNEEVIIDGQDMGYTYSHPYAPQEYIEELQPQKFIFDEEENITKKRWQSFVRGVEKHMTNNYELIIDENYKNNYLKAMQNANIPDEIIKKVKSINANEIVKLLRENYLQTEITYVYDKYNYSVVVEKLKSFWIEGQRNEKL